MYAAPIHSSRRQLFISDPQDCGFNIELASDLSLKASTVTLIPLCDEADFSAVIRGMPLYPSLSINTLCIQQFR